MQNFAHAFVVVGRDAAKRADLTIQLLSDPMIAALVKDADQAEKLVTEYRLLSKQEFRTHCAAIYPFPKP